MSKVKKTKHTNTSVPGNAALTRQKAQLAINRFYVSLLTVPVGFLLLAVAKIFVKPVAVASNVLAIFLISASLTTCLRTSDEVMRMGRDIRYQFNRTVAHRNCIRSCCVSLLCLAALAGILCTKLYSIKVLLIGILLPLLILHIIWASDSYGRLAGYLTEQQNT